MTSSEIRQLILMLHSNTQMYFTASASPKTSLQAPMSHNITPEADWCFPAAALKHNLK